MDEQFTVNMKERIRPPIAKETQIITMRRSSMVSILAKIRTKTMPALISRLTELNTLNMQFFVCQSYLNKVVQ